ncbi:MAG: glycosyltransferase [Clostridiales bacterium]|nr:glycosyltransferase [Clostridiales bacterium]
MSIKLSIGTAIYNIEEELLRENIESTVRQLTDETELLLIDDCSTNNSGEICREYAASDSRVRYINMGQNGGLSRVRNRTIDEAAGKWIFFADGDDLLSDHFVETALKFCDSEYDIIIHDRLKFIDKKQEEQPCQITELRELPREAGRQLSISCLCLDPSIGKRFSLPSTAFYHAAWGAIYRKDFLTKNGLRFPDGQKKAQDSVFNTRAYYYAENIAYLPYVMYYYRNNPQGITRRYSKDLVPVLQSLIGHLRVCMDEYYSGDEDVEERYLNHRVMSLLVDSMRLNVFHRDNPNDKEKRKKDFLDIIGSEPYKSALEHFDAKKYDRPEWHLPATLMRKKKFNTLDWIMRKDKRFIMFCGADKRLITMFGKKAK